MIFFIERYEIINEPWAGNYFTDPTLLLPGVAGSTNLQPFYEKIAQAIRSVDNDTLIFYEPVTWGGMLTIYLTKTKVQYYFSSIKW